MNRSYVTQYAYFMKYNERGKLNKYGIEISVNHP